MSGSRRAVPNCLSGASFTIAIEKRQLASAGGTFDASGLVGDGGNISVTMSSGLKRASSLGQLSGASGLDTWQAALCSGSWTASRDLVEERTWSLSCPALLRRQLADCAQDHRAPYNYATHFSS